VLCDFILVLVPFHCDWLAVSPRAPLCLCRMAADRASSSGAFAFRNGLFGAAGEGVTALVAAVPAGHTLGLGSQLGIPARQGSPRGGGYRRRVGDHLKCQCGRAGKSLCGGDEKLGYKSWIIFFFLNFILV